MTDTRGISGVLPLGRRMAIGAAAALPLVRLVTGKAQAAPSIRLKMASSQPGTHPTSMRMKEAAKRIGEKTDGRVQFRFFADGQMGSESDTISQLRGGGIDFLIVSAAVLATNVPPAGIVNLGFAFANYDQVWQALDGELGSYLRMEIAKIGVLPLDRIAANGFRQITSARKPIVSPADLKGFKIRVPVSPIIASLFDKLGAASSPISTTELYAALQTGIVDGQENPLPIIASTRIYEVQKYASLTDHVFDALFPLGNQRVVDGLPADVRDIILAELRQSVMDQRKDVMAADAETRKFLVGKGLEIRDVDQQAFKQAVASTSFYHDWKAKFGDQAWSALESSVGRLG